MRIFIVSTRFIIVLLMLLMTSKIYGKTETSNELPGRGTKYNPYIIETLSDWDIFADENNHEIYWANGVYTMLSDTWDDSQKHITKPVGSQKYPYEGYFDGNWKTLNVVIDSKYANYVAPFAYVRTATIENLTITGSITNEDGNYMGGMIGCILAPMTESDATIIRNCTSNVDIKTKMAREGYHGGFVGKISNGIVNFIHCIFNGSISGKGVTECAGFVGVITGGIVNYESCTMTYENVSIQSDFNTFHLMEGGSASFNETYYTRRQKADGQGVRAPSSPVDGKISKKYSYNNVDYYVPAADYEKIGENIIYGGSIDPKLSYYGKMLELGEDYRVVLKETGKDMVIVSITGNPVNDFYGEIIINNITLVNINTWSSLNELLKNNTNKRIITLTQDYIADDTDDNLQIVGDKTCPVVLELNGYTIDRNLYDKAYKEKGYVIKVERNAYLTIKNKKDTGGIRGGKTEGNGGGIYSQGVLVLENVKVWDNESVRKPHSSYNPSEWGEGGGIYCSGGSLTITKGIFTTNKTDGGGGAIYAENTAVNMNGVVVNRNYGESKGAGVHIYHRSNIISVINDCEISDNSLWKPKRDASDGGGIYVRGDGGSMGSVTVSDCVVTGNSVYRWGGGFFFFRGHLIVKNCIVEGNTCLGDPFNNVSQYGGGGIYIHSGVCTIDGSTVSGNVSHDVGGITVLKDANLHVMGNVVIDGNIGDAGKNNIYLYDIAEKIYIDGQLSSTANIHVSRPAIDNLTVGLDKHPEWGGLQNFKCDCGYMLVRDGDKGELVLNEALLWSKRLTDPNWGTYVYVKDNKLHIDGLVIIDEEQTANIEEEYGNVNIEYGDFGSIIV